MQLVESWQALLGTLSPLEFAFNIVSEIGLDPTDEELELTFSKCGMSITLPYASFPAAALRKFKRMVKLEVPSHQQDSTYTHKDLWGIVSLRRNYHSYDVDFRLGAALTCTKTDRVREIEPSEHTQRAAALLLAMTPDQALAKLRADATTMLKPREVPVYTCSPTKVA
jgi:hypothetical protein